MQFRDILKLLRDEKKLTQKEVAERCNISPTCICQLETGARNPTGSTLNALADFFECSTDYLLGRSDDLGIISIASQKETDKLSSDERQLIRDYRELAPALREMLQATIQTWKGTKANERKAK